MKKITKFFFLLTFRKILNNYNSRFFSNLFQTFEQNFILNFFNKEMKNAFLFKKFKFDKHKLLKLNLKLKEKKKKKLSFFKGFIETFFTFGFKKLFLSSFLGGIYPISQIFYIDSYFFFFSKLDAIKL